MFKLPNNSWDPGCSPTTAAGDSACLCLIASAVSEFLSFTIQPVTVPGSAVTQQSQEQLQSLTVASRVLRKGVEKVIGNVNNCLDKWLM